MPKISVVNLEHGTIAECLSRTRQVLLPEEIASDSLAQWIMSFDVLEDQDLQSDIPMDQIELGDRDGWVHQLYGHLVASILQMHIPFYFASLFHIGRQWKRAVYSLESIDDVEQPENLFTSARNLVRLSEASQRNADLSEEASVALLRRMCELGREQHSRQLDLARGWWKTWKNEVGSYQRLVTEIQAYFESRERNPNDMLPSVMRLLAQSMQGSLLKREMQQHGVRFKPEIAPQTPANQQFWWLLLGLALAGNNTRDSFYADFLLRDLVSTLRELVFAPRVEIALEMLKRKYGEENPFMRYGVGKSAATPELLDLIREHRLPDGSDSPWLSSWRGTLDFAPNRYDKLPIPGPQSGQNQVLSVRSADSTIKQNLTAQPLPAESWEGFLQRIFEKRWIQPIGMMAGRTNKETQSSTPPWDLHTFLGFITDVVVDLNKIGYSLSVPDSTRLAELLEKAGKSKDAWEDITW